MQLTYRENIYNTKLLYFSGTLTVTFCDSNDFFDGMSYKINSEICKISCNGITYEMPVEKLPDSFLPLIIYKFISDFGGVVPTENYDSESLCSYTSRNVFDSSVTLEVYETENNIAHSLHIT